MEGKESNRERMELILKKGKDERKIERVTSGKQRDRESDSVKKRDRPIDQWKIE